MKQKLPIGIQTFRKIIEDNCCYVDKTDIAYNLIERGSYYFLSRPRRFGKSLFLDTFAEIFKGSQELFKGLAIHDKWNWEKSFPVVTFDFGKGDFQTEENLYDTLVQKLKENAEKFDVTLTDSKVPSTLFGNLIRDISKKRNKPVVILIDEYDKPIIDNIANREMALKARSVLSSFYGTIKSSDQYLRFVFMTGVSKFSKMNLFSSLNNLQDITIDSNYATITGYTHSDLQTVFGNHLQDVNLEAMKKWYNGYNYFGEPIYNPFDILLFITNNCEFKNYWWETGNPSFLIEKLRDSSYAIPDLESIEVGTETLNASDIEYIDLAALLWQTGYITFDKKIVNPITMTTLYKMRIPNLEIQASLNSLFYNYLTQAGNKKSSFEMPITTALMEHNLEKLIEILKSHFAAIPYNNYTKDMIASYEGYYSSVIYTLFKSIGFDTISEDVTNKGRIDLTLIIENSVFIFEFKVDSNESAIEQIKERKYYEKYRSDCSNIYLVGIKFSSEERNIIDSQWEKL